MSRFRAGGPGPGRYRTFRTGDIRFCYNHRVAWVQAFLVGVAVGILAAAVTARVLVVRVLAKARAAERRARSAERLAELGAMTGGLAHEIKNPLSTIGLNAQLLAEGIEDLPTDQPLEAETKSRLARRLVALRREADRLRGILADFLAYAGELRLDPKPTDVNGVVDELVDFFHPQVQQQQVRLRSTLAPGPLNASVDVPLLKQALLNLMLNAVQAFGPAAASDSPRELIVRTEAGRDADGRATVCIHVIDTGPGIPAETAGKIFTPYFTTKAGGSGLGLPTTRRIIEAHAGRIDLASEPGKGSDFTVVLPAI